jgi:hypothetical protein
LVRSFVRFRWDLGVERSCARVLMHALRAALSTLSTLSSTLCAVLRWVRNSH